MKIEIFARRGIRINNEIEILLGSHIKEAIRTLGKYDKYETHYYFFDSNLLLCTKQNKIAEIEIRNDECSSINAIFNGRNIFSEERNTLFPYLCQLSDDVIAEEYELPGKEYHYSSDKLGIGFGYECTENDVKEIIEEAKKDGTYKKMKADIEKDIYHSKHLSAFLIR